MALNITQVHRNLHTRVTFMCLEFEDLFVILGIAALANVLGRFMHREVAGIPLNILFQYIVPIAAIPFLIAFKYGNRTRSYEKDGVKRWVTELIADTVVFLEAAKGAQPEQRPAPGKPVPQDNSITDDDVPFDLGPRGV